ncbi:CRISPR-associated protein CT1974 [Solidesulfovibrio fructosivorans JJ]]|uniref:CRISPR-associated protein CT1974 n=1 Tax=Solidesulfovibrio fructosivorans JJ] TaxID=596151 RepID=E1JXX3_SOLFR|nr:type I-E CRISPR-associated protein Cas6/Cse3/CasE [Solidesulfovibrio fructosivorans]EFL50711.1 CRISPR-associated protein CT1974 [Solidesulfovibrio fructosivorans JJ]]
MALYMMQLEIVPRRLIEWSHQTGITAVDRGYLVHSAMRIVFGDSAPQPFALFGNADNPFLKVLGYGPTGIEALRAAVSLAEPVLVEAFPVERMLGKTMPALFATGSRFAFQVECCPITRNSRDGKIREKDAFLAACDAAPEGGVERASVYSGWVGAEVARDGAAELLECSMKGFRMFTPVRRKGKGNMARSIGQRPRARLDGVLRVGDPGAFAALLARGLGRHRAFGLGMLLLRPV